MSTTVATTLPTISADQVPPSLMNEQGMLDPIQIKKSSAAKMRLADKTGNIALRKEAAAEQSFADRLGGRTALLSDELKRQIEQQKLEATSTTTEQPKEGSEVPTAVEKEEPVVEDEKKEDSQEKGKRRSKKINKSKDQTQPQEEESESTQDQEQVRQRAPLKPTSQPFQPQQPLVTGVTFNSAFTGSVSVPPEALLLKLDAASKQSIADKTGNLVLKRTAALEQSLADKMAFVSAPGITTTALRAGRKGFMLDPLFQPQTAPGQKVRTMQHSASLTAVQQLQQSQQQIQHQPQQEKPKKTMQQSKSMSSIQSSRPTNRSDQPNWRQPHQPLATPTTPTPAPTSTTQALQRKPLKLTPRTLPIETPTQPKPISPRSATTDDLPQPQQRPSSDNKRSMQRSKSTKIMDPVVLDDITKIKQQIAEVVINLTPAAASM